jgi:chromosome segregation ATPase
MNWEVMTEAEKQEKVNEICNDFYSRGVRFSVADVRDKLPNVSSRSTAQKFVSKWRDAAQEQENKLMQNGMSDDFNKALAQEIYRLTKTVENSQKALIQQAREHSQEAIEDLVKIESQLEGKDALIAELQEQVATLKSELALSRQESQSALEKQEETHAAVEQELRNQLGAEKQTNTANQTIIDTLRNDYAKAQVKLESNQETVDNLRKQLSTIQTQYEARGHELAQAKETNASQRATLKENERFIEKLERNVEEARAATDTVKEELVLTNKRADEQKWELHAVRQSLESTNKVYAELRQTLNEMKQPPQPTS